MTQQHSIKRFSALALAALAPSALAQFEISRSTIDGGGAIVTGGPYTLTGTMGQADASTLSGGPERLFGGFWASTEGCGGADMTATGAANGLPDGCVDLCDFSFYLSLWSGSDARAAISATGTCMFSQGDGSVDLSDFSCYLNEWSQGCP